MDLYNLPDKSQKVQIFTTSGMWHKPRGISMVYIHIVGGGGGGNGGGTGALGTVRAVSYTHLTLPTKRIV